MSEVEHVEHVEEAVAAEAEEEEEEPSRRMVAFVATPCSGVDPQALYNKMKETIVSTPEYELKWDEACKIEDGKIYSSFTIAMEADFDEEVMEYIECMEDEVASHAVTFQTVLE
jgi:hypothetical protein